MEKRVEMPAMELVGTIELNRQDKASLRDVEKYVKARLAAGLAQKLLENMKVSVRQPTLSESEAFEQNKVNSTEASFIYRTEIEVVFRQALADDVFSPL